jgi:hypothetical protein
VSDGAAVLEFADRVRRSSGTPQPHRLYHEATEAFRRDEITFDEVTSVYRHAMVHAGAIVRKGGQPFDVCPECAALLDRGSDG